MLDIKAMAVEAGLHINGQTSEQRMSACERFAKLVARECAGICAAHQEGGIGGWKHNTPQDCEIAIRARFGLEG